MRLRGYSLLMLPSLALVLLLGACSGPQLMRLEVGDVLLRPGERGKVTISVINPPDVQTIQIGPLGSFTFDPAVIHVIAVRGINGFQVLASGIDNAAGAVKFAAGFPGSSIGPIVNSWARVKLGIVELEVEAVGGSGRSCTLAINAVDLLADRHGKDVPLAGIIAGEAKVR